MMPGRTPKLCISVDEDTNLCILEERHAQELFELVDDNRAHLRAWLPWVDYERSAEDSRAFIKDSLRQFANNQGFQLGIWYKGQLAGTIGYHPINWFNRKVAIECATGNKRSCAIPERLGFRREGVLRDGEWLYDHYVDLAVYGMLARDWHQ